VLVALLSSFSRASVGGESIVVTAPAGVPEFRQQNIIISFRFHIFS
jgi:hypothetical protein